MQCTYVQGWKLGCSMSGNLSSPLDMCQYGGVFSEREGPTHTVVVCSELYLSANSAWISDSVAQFCWKYLWTNEFYDRMKKKCNVLHVCVSGLFRLCFKSSLLVPVVPTVNALFTSQHTCTSPVVQRQPGLLFCCVRQRNPTMKNCTIQKNNVYWPYLTCLLNTVNQYIKIYIIAHFSRSQ